LDQSPVQGRLNFALMLEARRALTMQAQESRNTFIATSRFK